MSQIANQIWNKLFEGKLDEIKVLIIDYEEASDKNFNHPILHEISHQAGNKSYYIYNEDNEDNEESDILLRQKERFERQNEVFKYLFKHNKFKNLLFNDKYIDKYGYTVLERLRIEYENYCEDMKIWIRNNILPEIDKVIIKVDNYGNMYLINKHFFNNNIQ